MVDDIGFPTRDPVGSAGPPFGDSAVRLIAAEVAARAQSADAEGVLRTTIDALAASGLLGAPLPSAQQRELAELLAGSDASTWFCWAQHQTPMRLLEEAGSGAPARLREELLPELRAGRQLAAVAFAHVRRPGPPDPVATRVDGGWRLDGTLDWVTSWDIADVVMVMAHAVDEDALVCSYLPAGRAPHPTAGVRPHAPLRLLAMSGTHTRPVSLDAVFVPDEQVGAVVDRGPWLEQDARRTADASPSAFGLARGAIAELASLAERRADQRLGELVQALVVECRELREQAYSAMDDPNASRPERLRLRARSLDLAARSTTAVIVARAGAAMRSGSSAERRLREAMFLQVQAQTADTRAASIDLLRQASGR